MESHVTVKTQVGNLLNVLNLHSGQFVKGKLENGKRVSCSHLNPLMADGGVQPSGAPLYGPRFYDSAAELEAVIVMQTAKDPKLAGRYFVMPVSEWVMATRLHGGHKTLAKVLEERPELRGATPEAPENMPADWVLTLPPDEPVDVSLGDGVSEDCFVTTAGELTRQGFGQLTYERNASGATVFTRSHNLFARLGDVCGT